MNDLDAARNEVSRSSAGGAPFLIVFGATLLVCAVGSLFVTRQQAAMMVMFQGGIALPLAFLLERRMASGCMADDNPLRPLSIQLAMSQIVAFPVVILVYSLNPGGVPLTMAAIAGGHFLPYAWLQRTRVYVWLAVAVSAGALAIQIALGSRAFPWVLGHMTLCYWIAAPLVYRAAALKGRPTTSKRRARAPSCTLEVSAWRGNFPLRTAVQSEQVAARRRPEGLAWRAARSILGHLICLTSPP